MNKSLLKRFESDRLRDARSLSSSFSCANNANNLFDSANSLFNSMFSNIEDVSNKIFGGKSLPARLVDCDPRVDILETDTSYIISAEVPGINQDQLEVHLDGNILSIIGEKKEEHQETKNGYRHHERSYGKFSRQIQLPLSVSDTEKVKTSLRDGILKVEIPKNSEKTTKTRLTIT